MRLLIKNSTWGIFLSVGEVLIDDSASERALKNFTMGKRNRVTIYIIKGTQACAIIYSITETSIVNSLSMYYFIYHLLAELSKFIDNNGIESLKKILCYAQKKFQHFNISHSGNWVVLSVAEYPIGIDVEKVEPIDLQIAKTFLNWEEIMQLELLENEEKIKYFYTIWTLKEVYLKALGVDLNKDMKLFSFKNLNGEIHLSDNENTNEFQHLVLDKITGYMLSCCINKFEQI